MGCCTSKLDNEHEGANEGKEDLGQPPKLKVREPPNGGSQDSSHSPPPLPLHQQISTTESKHDSGKTTTSSTGPTRPLRLGAAPASRTASLPGTDPVDFGNPLNPSATTVKSKPNAVTQPKPTTYGGVTKKADKGAHQKNVFATPLEQMGSLRAPVYPKELDEEEFVQEALKNNFVFAALTPREFKTIIDAFERVVVSIGDTLIQQGDVGDYFYVIREGKVRFEVNRVTVGHAATGKSFGELSLLYTSPRAASVIAETDTVLYRVDQKTFRYLMQSQTLQTENDKKELLQRVPFLKSLDPTDINKLIHTMIPRVFEPGEYLVRKGDVGDTFYVIQEGLVSVTEIRIGSTNYEDQTLGPGDYFGERALATKEPRAANCVGKTKGIALCIDKETFEKVVGNLAVLTLKSEDSRKLSAIKLFKLAQLSQPSIASLASQIRDRRFSAKTVVISEGAKTLATLYFIRSGKVEIRSEDGQFDNVVEAGGYFGEDMLALDVGGIKSGSHVVAKYTVTVLDEELCAGVLSILECRKIIDTTTLGIGKPLERRPTELGNHVGIALKSLTRHAILGAGTFGHVWLVSKESPDGTRHPYALKIQSKYELLEHKQAKAVVQEKNLMQQLHHPFLIDLVRTYQDDRFIYMLLEIVQGGELLSLLHQASYDGISEKDSKFYASGILEGLSYIHRRHIVYRDLKPENVLIDHQGYPVIVDFGFAKYVIGKTYTLCGTPLYIAPEVILNRGHDVGADHWSYGVLLFEMIAGHTPFFSEGMDQISLFRAICAGKYRFPPAGVMTMEAEDLIERFLVLDPAKRLGSLARALSEIYSHTWYDDIDFNSLFQKEIPAPWVPEITDPLDNSNFHDWGHLEDKIALKESHVLTDDEQRIFEEF